MPYRFAIVGCGNISGRHAAAIQRVGSLVGVCDPDRARAGMLADMYKVPHFADPGEMFTSIQSDIAVICSPTALHPEHTIAALEAGIDVLCEKPAALTTDQALAMIEVANRSRKKLFVVKQNRYTPSIRLLKKLLDEGKLGHIRSFQINCFWNRDSDYYQAAPWRGQIKFAGGTLFTQFSHFIDLMCWLLGDVSVVSGWRANFQHQNIIDFEDTGVASLILTNGAIGSINYTINASSRNMEGSISLFGDKGTIKIGGEYLNRIEHFVVQDVSLAGFEEGLLKIPENRHDPVYEELLRSLGTPGYNMVDGNDAIKTIRAIEMIYKASPMI